MELELLSEQQYTDEECGTFDEAHITRLHINEISYNEFFWRYMKANRPIVLTGLSSDWECRKDWAQRPNCTTANVEDNRLTTSAINFDYLKEKVGNCVVPVADCCTEYFNSHIKSEMNFNDFLDYWKEKSISINTIEQNCNSAEPSEKTSRKNLYLKDWHLQAQMPDYEFYRVPKYFASDWLNELLVNTERDDYRFVYMGPKGSWTPFHMDVFGSYSWSTNIVGCKKWILLPPNEELKLIDRLGNLPFCIDEDVLVKKGVRFFTLLQKEDEAIFVPSAWYHQVWNITNTISVNHNWFNACNILHVWKNLSSNMCKVINEIEDCRQMDNFEEHCQTMLRATFGMNYLDFLELLEFITERRLQCINDSNKNTAITSKELLLFDKFTPNDYHIRYDLQAVHNVIKDMLQDSIVSDNCRPTLHRRCHRLMELTKGF